MWKKIIISLFAASLLFVAYLSCADIANPFPASDTTVKLYFVNSKGDTTTTELFTDTIGDTVKMRVVPYLSSNIEILTISIVNRVNNVTDTEFVADKFKTDFDTLKYAFSFKIPGARAVRAIAQVKAVGKKEITAEFIIASRPIKIVSQPVSVKVDEGAKAAFDIKIADTNKIYTYAWLKDGNRIANENNDTFVIKSVTIKDVGLYTCVVKNKTNDSVISNAGALIVNPSSSSIKISSQPTSLAVAEGAKAVLGISIENADPTYSYYWLQNGIIKAGETKDTLTINAVSQSDTGSYVCVIKKGNDSTASSVVNLSISSLAPSNHAPKLEVKGLLNILVDKPCSLSLSATDADAGQTVAYSLGFGPKDGVLTADKFVWTPASGFTGTDSVLFIVKDNGTPSLSDSVKVVISVSKSIPLPDSVSSPTAVSRKNGVFTFTWGKASNADGYIVYRATTLDGIYAVVDTTSGTQYSDSVKTASYYYVKSMNQMGTSGASEKVSSSGINTAPKWQKDTISISGQQNAPLSLNLANSVQDANGDVVTVKIASGAPVTATIEGLIFKFTPTATDVGPYTVKLGAYDGIDSSFATMILTFSSTNKAPAITSVPDTTINETQVLALKLIAVDPDGTTPIMSATSLDGSALPVGATFAPATGIFAWTPAIGQAGVYKIVFSATDGTLTDKDTVVVTVGKTNRPPVLSGATDVNVAVGAPVNFTVTATDPDADKVTITTSTLPAGATFTAATGVFDWKPTTAQTGGYKVTFTATDGKLPVIKEITITISNNPVPKITVDPVAKTLLGGKSDSMFVTATAAGTITYQWQLNGKDVVGETKNVIKLATVDVKDTGSYVCVVTNDGGKVSSKSARLIVQYTVSYDGNTSTGGTVPASANVNIGATVTVSANSGTLVKTGYLFDGWNTKLDGSGTSYIAATGAFAMGTANVALFAKWKIDSYTITFDKNGGDVDASPKTKDVNYNGKVDALPKQPTQNGYTFSKWTIAKDGTGGTFDATSVVTKGMTVYAQWSLINYKITYNLDNGTLATTPPATYNITSAEITLPAPTRFGYDPTGWYNSSGTKETKIASGSTGDKTFTATWAAKTYKINYTLNGGTNSSQNPGTYTYSASIITLKDPTPASGYTFDAWYTDSKFTSTSKSNSIAAWASGDQNFYAHWNPKSYTLTMAVSPAGAGSATADNLKPDHGATVKISATPSAGYTFKDWSVTSGSATLGAGSVSLTSNATVQANFSLLSYNINYEGTGVTNPPNNTYKTSYTINDSYTPAILSKAGYSFSWSPTSISKGSTGVKTFTGTFKANKPDKPIITGSLSVCYGKGFTLNASAANASAMQWYNNQSPLPGQTGFNLTVTSLTENQTYHVVAYNADKSESSVSDNVTVVVGGPTKPTVKIYDFDQGEIRADIDNFDVKSGDQLWYLATFKGVRGVWKQAANAGSITIYLGQADAIGDQAEVWTYSQNGACKSVEEDASFTYGAK